MTRLPERKRWVGGARLQRPIQPQTKIKQAPLRILPWWIAFLGAAVVGGAIWASTAWLLTEANKASRDGRAQLRIDAIRTGLAVGAGAGGAFALILAVRRQWLHERAQAHQEQVAASELQTPPMPQRAFRPVLALVSDGLPTDNWRADLRAINDTPAGKRAIRVAVAIGDDADRNMLKEFLVNPELEPLLAGSPKQLAEAILWTSTMAVKEASIPLTVEDYKVL